MNGTDTRPAPDGETTSPAIGVDAAARVNFASAQNDIPVIRSLTVGNPGDTAFEGVTLRLSAHPPMIRPKAWPIDRLAPGEELSLRDLGAELDLQALAGLDETERGTLTLELSDATGRLAALERPIEFLARDQWGGLADMDRLLAAYVSPNDAAVAGLLKEASRLLVAAGHDGALEGYQSGDPGRAWMIAGAIWSAATGLGLTYATPPASFDSRGQKIRFPDRVKREGLATCLDTSLLLAAAWEQAGLHPAVIFTEGHAFAGVWLLPKDFGAVTEPDVIAVRKAVQAREFVVVETTCMTKKPSIGFEDAIAAARPRLSEDREHEFLAAVDICRARSARIRPLASHSAAPRDGTFAHVEIAPAGLPKPIAFGLLPDDASAPAPDTPKGRIERWQGKLLDLSLRNRLLNYKASKQSVPCRVPSVAALEDALAAGTSFRTYPLLEEDPVGDRQVPADERERIVGGAVRNAFDRGQVTIDLDKAETDRRLLALFRKAKSDLQEGGTNTLFLAAGVLRWQREGDPRPYRAPLLLIPIRLERRSARSEFRILHHEDEPRFNATLLEFLKRDFDLALPELEGDLPADASGIDVRRIFEIMRARVRDVPGFEVIEDVAISTFSFSKYLMWKDLVDRTDQLRSNRLVAHLVDNPDTAFDTGFGDPIRPDEIDARIAPKDMVTPLPADSSQLAAVAAAVDGRDFVLIGPPGTGKSQTIANIICQCMAHGKTVLFVAEKAAALDVVQRRLEAHGLGDAVLELHSNKTDRKRVLSQLGRGWDRAAGAAEATWIEVNEKLRVERDRLNAYVAALHRKGTQGFSVFEALGWIAREPDGLVLAFGDRDAHDAASFARLAELSVTLERTRAATRDIPPLALIGGGDWSFAWQSGIVEAGRALRAATDRMVAAGTALERRIGLRATGLPADRIEILDRFAERAGDGADRLSAVPDLPRDVLQDALAAFEGRTADLAEARARLAASYDEAEILRMPLDRMDADWRAAGASFWPVSALRRRKVRKLLQSYATGGTASPEGDLRALGRMRDRLRELQTDPITAIAGPGRSVDRAYGLANQAYRLRTGLDHAADEVGDSVAFGTARAALIAGPDGRLADELLAWAAARQAQDEALGRFEAAGGCVPDGMPATDLIREIDLVLANRDRLSDWTRWQEARAAAGAAGLGALAERLEAGEIAGAADAFRKAYARWWLPLALDASEPLRRFAHWDHEDRIRTFRDLDDRAAELAPAEVMRRIAHRLPARDGVPRNSGLGTLRHQLGLQRPSMAIRTLLGSLGDALPRLAPCVLMSPLSIAQYLPAGQQQFDLVIFDEASQITTWDAVGAIARGRQSIIVGDPKQLPPTNFFGRADDGDEDGEPLLGDMPSILDEVATAGIPTRRLTWHYRSRDEALIAFSNHFYYDGGLVTFPAPATASDAVRFHRVDGTYARGQGRTNRDEANAIVAMIRTRLSDWLTLPEAERPTLGVITFNAQQQALILDLLDDLRRARPELEWFFAEEREEPVIVKNLENIQGDERDVMLFSITFGRDAAGKLSMGFGALNQDGGEKRLNVAVTRARQELHVFASITADQIDLSRTRATGVRDLKTFLDYADRGPVAIPAADTGSRGPAESPFEDAVAQTLRAKGWEVRTQIGVSGFRIDLGIVNPDRAGAYLAGIECDGATYHGSATARDRDKVRQAVLEGLGWSILRIWSTDWFRDAAAVADRVHAALEGLLAADRAETAEDAVPEDAPEIPALPAPDRGEGARALPPPGDGAVGGSGPSTPPGTPFAGATADRPRTDVASPGDADEPRPDQDAFFDARYLPTLRTLIDGIVARAAPLPLNVLAREVARRHGWARTGQRINDRVRAACRHLDLRSEDGRVFVWPAGGYRERVAYRGLDGRWIQEVSRSEIASVLDGIADGLSYSEDPVLDLARDLGISRLSTGARAYLGDVWAWYHASAAREDAAVFRSRPEP